MDLAPSITPARPDDAGALTAIALAAKRHWGYPDTWIDAWQHALTITPDYILAHPTFVAVVGQQPVGFGAVQIDATEALLDHLWVMPALMGRGVGRRLFQHAEHLARSRGARRIRLVGDPHATAFYLRMGASLHGRQRADMDGQFRELPLFEKPL